MRYMLTLCLIVGMVAVIAGALGGCASEPPVQPVAITADNYCQIAAKVTWSVDDTRRTIQEVRRENAKHDARCREKPTT
jgi:hypothetical protein